MLSISGCGLTFATGIIFAEWKFGETKEQALRPAPIKNK
jgi:hypothetical protein